MVFMFSSEFCRRNSLFLSEVVDMSVHKSKGKKFCITIFFLPIPLVCTNYEYAMYLLTSMLFLCKAYSRKSGVGVSGWNPPPPH